MQDETRKRIWFWGLFLSGILGIYILFLYPRLHFRAQGSRIAEVLRPRIAADPRFARVRVERSSSGIVYVTGEVGTDSDLEALKQLIEQADIPWRPGFLVHVSPAAGSSTAPAAPSSATAAADAPSPSRPAESPTVRIAIVDMQRLFDAHPDTKPSENAIHAKRDSYKTEIQHLLDSGDADAAKRFRDLHEKELQDDTSERRKEIVTDLQRRVKDVSIHRNFDLVFDVSGKNLNGVPVIMHASGFPDITNDILDELSR